MERSKRSRYNLRNVNFIRYQYVCDGADLVSELPDELIINILSNLTCEEGCRTSVLSKRWKTCWTFTKAVKFDTWHSLPQLKRRKQTLQSHRELFVKKVTHVFSLLKSPTLESVHLRCHLTMNYQRRIDDWIKIALEKKSESLALMFMEEGEFSHDYSYYPFPADLLTSTNIKKLRSISLGLSVTDDVFHYFLSNCPFLENLAVAASYSLEYLKVDGPSLNLKYLKISNCFRIKWVRISAPKLLSYQHSGGEAIVLVKNTTYLSDLLIGGMQCKNLAGQLRQFFGYFSQLESLTLDAIHKAQWSCAEELPQLTNLRHLEIRFRIYSTEAFSRLSYFSILEACPSLRSIKVKRNVLKSSLYSSYDFGEKINVDPPDRPLEHLKLVESAGFVGCRSDVEILMLLLKLRAPIDKVIIHITEPALGLKEIDKLLIRDRALNIELPPGAQLLILNSDGEYM